MSYSPNLDPEIEYCQDRVFADFGDTVSVAEKNKGLYKFGRNTAVGTSSATIMTLQGSELNETYVSTNAITHFASSSGSDTEDIVVEGHTVDGSGNFTFVSQTVTLAGQTKTALSTPLARATRVYNDGSNDLVGNVYISTDVTYTSGVPDTASATKIMIPAGLNQSQKASTTLSNVDYYFVTSFGCYYLDKAAGFADAKLEVRLKGKTFREQGDIAVADGAQGALLTFKPYLIVPKNSDIRVTAVADGASTSVDAFFQGYLAKVV